MKLEYLGAALEAVLFAAGEPMEEERLAEAMELPVLALREITDKLAAHYDETGSSLQLLRLGTSYQITTRPAYAERVRHALEIKKNTPLSNAAMETLTIIAYNQPVTKGFVERVRGVDSSSVVNTLAERGLLEEAGRIEVPGRPVAYRTTAHFLRCFGLASIADLPPLPTSTEPDLFAVKTDADEILPEETLEEAAEENIETFENEDYAPESEDAE